jgi:hypothetical protein
LSTLSLLLCRINILAVIEFHWGSTV